MLTDWTLEGFTFQVRFTDVSGLEAENPVYYHGYKVGKVKRLSLQRDGSILVTVRLLQDIVIPRDVIFTRPDSPPRFLYTRVSGDAVLKSKDDGGSLVRPNKVLTSACGQLVPRSR